MTFRKHSTHSICGTCDLLRSKIKHSKHISQHVSACNELLRHLSNQWKNRFVYWQAREKSKERSGLLTLIVDGYDKSKLMLPRWLHGRTPKGFERVRRLHLSLAAVILHGHGCCIYVCDEIMMAGSSYTWEIILRSLDRAWSRCQSRGETWPSKLYTQKLVSMCYFNTPHVNFDTIAFLRLVSSLLV